MLVLKAKKVEDLCVASVSFNVKALMCVKLFWTKGTSKSAIQTYNLEQNSWMDTFLTNLFWTVLFEEIIFYLFYGFLHLM